MSATDFQNMKPRMIEAYFRELIRETMGNKVEDKANVNAHSGSYYVSFAFEGVDYAFKFKKRSAERVAKAIRALKTK